MMEIRSIFTGKIIFSSDVDSIKGLVEIAVRSGADLSRADLSGADLYKADLSGANLSGANLSRTDLSRADLSNFIVGVFSVCPEVDSFTAYKTASGHIVTLEIPSHAKRSSATTRKCRASEAKVIAIDGADEVASNWDSNFIYRVGETVKVEDFDENRWNECSTGIHFFMTRQEAELWCI